MSPCATAGGGGEVETEQSGSAAPHGLLVAWVLLLCGCGLGAGGELYATPAGSSVLCVGGQVAGVGERACAGGGVGRGVGWAAGSASRRAATGHS